MSVTLARDATGTTPIELVDCARLAELSAELDAPSRRWMAANGFTGAPDTQLLMPGPDGAVATVWAGVREVAHPFELAGLPAALPAGRYRLGERGLAADEGAAALAWTLGSYAFDLYKPRPREAAELVLAPGPAASRGCIVGTAINATRDLVNTPAEHLGPAELAAAVQALARAQGHGKGHAKGGARFRQIVGDELLTAGFPAIHAVGRAATRAPRLIELDWGRASDPLVVLVGKGVCFDSGGLDLKPADAMRWMKKDMGGAANAIGLAQAIMALALPIRLKLLIPAVENAIAGNAYRPGDVFKTRRGLHIEIGNTDAEGRVILCDALAYGAEAKPALMIDLATLTGAARVALGAQLPALFCRDLALARGLVDLGLEQHDPLWHMPLWKDYHGGIESNIADIVNTGRNTQAGAINAALFLDDFVPEAMPWLHVDLYAWNDTARPGRPAGGEAQALRTLLVWLERRFTGG